MFAKKSLGQNFLMHRQTAERIVAAAELEPGSLVVEIGPGTGMLTRALLDSGFRVHAVEADATLIPGLTEAFTKELEEGRLRIEHEDVRTLDLSKVARPYHVVANIPYYITGEIIRKFLTHQNHPASMTLLVQKEVAERVARSPKESLLSLSIKAYGVPSYRFTVPRGAFKPAPNVDSAVLNIREIAKQRFTDGAAEARFFAVLRAGFAQKRKQLLKNLETAGFGDVRIAFDATGLSYDVRAEDLSIDTWSMLATRVKSS